jgi:hypothetical protein
METTGIIIAVVSAVIWFLSHFAIAMKCTRTSNEPNPIKRMLMFGNPFSFPDCIAKMKTGERPTIAIAGWFLGLLGVAFGVVLFLKT